MSRLNENTVCLELAISTLGIKRKVAASEVVDDQSIDPAMLHVAKSILDAEALKTIRALDSQFKTWLKARTLPQSLLKGGLYLLPLALVSEVDQAIQAYQGQRDELVEAFLDQYEDLQNEARDRLAGQFNADDYPTRERVREAFGVGHRYLTLNVPAALERVNREIYERQLRAAEVQWAHASDEIRDALRASFAELVGHMTDRLGFDPDTGRPRVFRNTMVEHMEAFLSTFEHRNLTSDNDLQALVQQARDIMSGVTPEQLRGVDNVRNGVQARFAEIQASLDTMITTAPARRIRLDP